MLTEINYTLPMGLSRVDTRNTLINLFLSEAPGTGTGENASKYIYFVEHLQDGNRIFLKRPAALNKGFDFTVNVESHCFTTQGGRHVSTPSHNNIFNDLLAKKNENVVDYTHSIVPLINRLFLLQCVTDENLTAIPHFTIGFPCDVILKSLKWLFIEQDITYWNNSGRQMLFAGLRDRHLV